MSKDELDYSGEIEGLSEGWWASVMDDDCYKKSLSRKSQKIQPQVQVDDLKPKAEEETDWSYVRELFDREEVISGTVIDFNKGGLLVCGERFQGFVPISHLDEVLTLKNEDRITRLEKFVGKPLCLKVIECDQHRGRIVLSERAAQAKPGQRQKLLEDLKIGCVVSGRVTNVTDFGVFVDLGGVEGLVHISELSWGRVIDPHNHAKINQELQVLVLQINREQCRVSLSVKQTKPNPWKEVFERYPKGKVLQAKITEIVKFGAFARLEDGLEGLIHISELNCENSRQPKEIFFQGQQVAVEIVLVDAERQRMSLRLVE